MASNPINGKRKVKSVGVGTNVQIAILNDAGKQLGRFIATSLFDGEFQAMRCHKVRRDKCALKVKTSPSDTTTIPRRTKLTGRATAGSVPAIRGTWTKTGICS